MSQIELEEAVYDEEADFSSNAVYEVIDNDIFSLFPIRAGNFNVSPDLNDALNWLQSHSYITELAEDEAAGDDEVYFSDETYIHYLEYSITSMYQMMNDIMQAMFASIALRYTSNFSADSKISFPDEWRIVTRSNNADSLMKFITRGTVSYEGELLPTLKFYPSMNTINDLIDLYNLLPPQLKASLSGFMEQAMKHCFQEDGKSGTGM